MLHVIVVVDVGDKFEEEMVDSPAIEQLIKLKIS